MSRAAKPRRENRRGTKRACLTCQDDEGSLRHFFRQMRVAKVAQGD